MKLRRFTDAGIAAVRETLPKIEETGDLSLAAALVADENRTELIAELADLDLDPDRTFPTTYAFCEYFHSLMKDHKPLAYRTDVGFWTWLAMVYVKQLVKIDNNGMVVVGAVERLVYAGGNFNRAYRHLLAPGYYMYHMHSDIPEICRVVLFHPINLVGDLSDQIMARQTLLQNASVLQALTLLYFDPEKGAKSGSGGSRPGAIRRFIEVFDQLAMTRDFFNPGDEDQLIKLLPEEFERFVTQTVS